MAKYVNIPGKGKYEFPDSMSDAEIRSIVNPYFQNISPYIPREVPTFTPPTPLAPPVEEAGFGSTFKDQFTTLLDLPEAISYGIKDDDTTRDALIKAQEGSGESLGGLENVKSVGDFWRWAKELAGGSAGFLTPAIAATKGASLVGGPIAGLVAGSGTLLLQYITNNLGRQAQENQQRIDAGEEEIEASIGKAAASAAGSTLLDVTPLKFFPGFAKLIGLGGSKVANETAEEIIQKATKNLEEGKDVADGISNLTTGLKEESLKKTIAKGAGLGVAIEVPQEVVQTALERWQAGLELTGEEANKEYFEAAVGGALLGAPFGSVGKVIERAQKKQAQERDQLPPEETPPGTVPTDTPPVQGEQGELFPLSEEEQALRAEEQARQQELVKQQELVALNNDANILFRQQEEYNDTGENIPEPEFVNNIAERLGLEERVDPQLLSLDDSFDDVTYNNQVENIITKAKEKLQTPEFTVRTDLDTLQEPVSVGEQVEAGRQMTMPGFFKPAPETAKTTEGLEPIYVHSVGIKNNLPDPTGRNLPRAKPIDYDKPVTVQDLSREGFEGTTHTVVMDVDEILKVFPDAQKDTPEITRNILEARDKIESNVEPVEIPSLEVSAVETLGRKKPVFISTSSPSKSLPVLQALKELGVKKVPVDINLVEGKQAVQTLSNIKGGFSTIGSVDTLILPDPTNPSEKLVLDFNTGEVIEKTVFDKAQKPKAKPTLKPKEKPTPKPKPKTDIEKPKIDVEGVPTGTFSPNTESLIEVTKDIQEKNDNSRLLKKIVSGEVPVRKTASGAEVTLIPSYFKNLQFIEDILLKKQKYERYAHYDIAYINKDKNGNTYGLIANEYDGPDYSDYARKSYAKDIPGEKKIRFIPFTIKNNLAQYLDQNNLIEFNETFYADGDIGGENAFFDYADYTRRVANKKETQVAKFSENELKELMSAAKVADKKLKAIYSSPDGPFKKRDYNKDPSSNPLEVKVSEALQEKLKPHADIKGLLELMGRKLNMRGTRIYIHDGTDTGAFIRKRFSLKFRKGLRASRDNVLGYMQDLEIYNRSDKKKETNDYVIFATPKEIFDSEGEVNANFLDTIMHEFGHVVHATEFTKATPETQKAVLDEWAKWYRKNVERSDAEFFDTRELNLRRIGFGYDDPKRRAAEIKRVLRTSEEGVLKPDMEAIKGDKFYTDRMKKHGRKYTETEYNMSFREWFANQTAKWALTQKEPRTVTEKFFKRVANKVKQFFRFFDQWLKGEGKNLVDAGVYKKNYLSSTPAINRFYEEMRLRAKYTKPTGQSLREFDEVTAYPLLGATPKVKDANLNKQLDAIGNFTTKYFTTANYEEDAGIEYSIQNPVVNHTEINHIVDDGIKRLPKKTIPDRLKDVLRGGSSLSRKALLRVMGVDLIKDTWTNLMKGKIDGKEVKPLTDFDKFKNDFEGELRTRIKDGTEIAKKIGEFKGKNRDNGIYDALQSLFYGSTYANIDMNEGPPKKPKSGKETTEYKEQVQAYRNLKPLWEKVGPEGKELYNDVRDYYSKAFDELIQSFKVRLVDSGVAKDLADEKIREIFKTFNFSKSKLKFYFPLKRNGKYWVNFSLKVTNEDGSISTEPVSLAFRSRGEMERAAAAVNEMKKTNPDITDITSFQSKMTGDSLYSGNTIGIPQFKKIKEIVSKNVKDLKDSEQIINELGEMFVATLPERSALRSLIVRRKNVLGATGDIEEVFAASSIGQARQISRLRHVEKMQKSLEQLDILFKTAFVNSPDEGAFRDVQEALERHLDEIRSPKVGPVISVGGKDYNILNNVGKLGFAYYLLTPAAFLINAVQTPTYGASLLAGRNGLQSSYRALMRASTDVLKGGRKNRVKVNGESVPGGLSNEEAAAISQAYIDGVLDRTQLNEAGLDPEEMTNAEIATGKVTRAVQIIMNGFSTVEKYNREITFLAAYRLAKQNPSILNKGRDKYTNALEYAKDLTTKSHFNYSASNSGLLFKDPKFKSILMFKKYPVNMYYTWWRVLKDSFGDLKKEGFSDADIKDIKRQARDQLFGLSATAFATAGLFGVPLWELWQWVIGSLFDQLDDEDVDIPAGERIRNYLRNTSLALGLPEGVGEVIYKGPLQALLGIEIARRLGGGASPFSSPVAADDEASLLFKAVEVILGPVGAMALNIEEGARRLQREDVDFIRAIEISLPLGLRNILKGIRYTEEETATSLAGLPIVDDISKFQIFMQVMGFTPAEISRQFDLNNARMSINKDVLNRRLKLLTKASIGVLHSDQELINETMKEIEEFNKNFPTMPIRSSSIYKSAQMKRRFMNTNELYKLGGVTSLKPKDLQFYDDKLGFISE